MGKYQNKYRNESSRLSTWDYSADGAYFITICTKDKEHYFGEILNPDKIEFSEIGQYVHKCWLEIPMHFPFVRLDEFIVMPDHVHGILFINKQNINCITVGTQYLASLQQQQQQNKFGPQSQNLASIVRGFKIGITKFARINKMKFYWQSRYHDHIIRNNSELELIRNYIITNPTNWGKNML